MRVLLRARARADTPWVVVGGTAPYYNDGNLLEYQELLKHTVCAAYTGTKPAGCSVARDYA